MSNKIPPTCIWGKQGTGKGIIARKIHWDRNMQSDKDKDKDKDLGNERRKEIFDKFVPFSCRGIQPEMLESRFLGRKDFFEQAIDGTLFLYEMDHMPVHNQIQLLKWMQSWISEIGVFPWLQ